MGTETNEGLWLECQGMNPCFVVVWAWRLQGEQVG